MTIFIKKIFLFSCALERNRAVTPTTQAGRRTRDLRDGGSTCHGSLQQEGNHSLSPTTTILINGSTQYSLLLSSSSSQISLGVSRGHPLAAAPAFLGGDPTVARGAPPVPGAADSPDGRPRPHGRHPLGWGGLSILYTSRTYSIPTTYNPKRSEPESVQIARDHANSALAWATNAL